MHHIFAHILQLASLNFLNMLISLSITVAIRNFVVEPSCTIPIMLTEDKLHDVFERSLCIISSPFNVQLPLCYLWTPAIHIKETKPITSRNKRPNYAELYKSKGTPAGLEGASS